MLLLVADGTASNPQRKTFVTVLYAVGGRLLKYVFYQTKIVFAYLGATLFASYSKNESATVSNIPTHVYHKFRTFAIQTYANFFWPNLTTLTQNFCIPDISHLVYCPDPDHIHYGAQPIMSGPIQPLWR